METECLTFLDHVRGVGVDGQQVGKLPANEFIGLTAEIIGQLLRYVGQLAEIIRFPKPAPPAAFELIDEMLCLAGVGFEPDASAARRDEASGAGDAVQEQKDRKYGYADRNQRRTGKDDCGRY